MCTEMERKEISPPIPMPKALAVASFAAKRAAREG
jgi:hypothetical protein